MDSRLPADSWRGGLGGVLETRLKVARTAPKQPLATKWGLDSLSRWKLSREFAEAYPFLDCSGGERYTSLSQPAMADSIFLK